MLTLRTKFGNLYYEKNNLYDSDKKLICGFDYRDTPMIRKLESIEDFVNFRYVDNAIWDTNTQDLYDNYMDIINWDCHLSDDEMLQYDEFLGWVNKLGDTYFVVNYTDIW